MPPWKGLHEQQVRQLGNKAASTTTKANAMSFTPINPPRALSAPNIPASRSASGTNAPTVTPVQTAVSTYLGRGDPQATAPLSQALQGTGTKKSGSGTRGKKRAATSQVATRVSKRRKRGAAGDETTERSKKAGDAELEQHVDVQDELVADEVEAGKPDAAGRRAVAVYTPTTSMDALQTSTQQTSLEVLKGANGRRKTLYRRPPTRGHEVAGVSYAKPLIEQGRCASADHAMPKVKNNDKATARAIKKGPLAPEERIEEEAGHCEIISKLQGKAPRHEPIIWTEDDFPDDFEDDSIDDADILAVAENVDTTSKAKQMRLEQSMQRKDSLEPDESLAKQNVPPRSDDEFDNGIEEDPELLEILASVKAKLTAANQVADSLLATPCSSDHITVSDLPNQHSSKKRRNTKILIPDEEFCVSDNDIPTDLTSGQISPPAQPTPPPRDRKLNMHEVSSNEDYGGALLTSDEVDLLAQLKSSSPAPTRRPIVRPPFPTPLLDRSPLYGATPSPSLRTCFRIGEALKAGAQAVRANEPVIVELFCCVGRSWREEKRQYFEFRDVYFPGKPPTLVGTWEGWSGRRVWAGEGRLLLQEDEKEERKMCRVVGRVKREGKGWGLEVLGAMQVGWEDVKFVAGVYGAE